MAFLTLRVLCAASLVFFVAGRNSCPFPTAAEDASPEEVRMWIQAQPWSQDPSTEKLLSKAVDGRLLLSLSHATLESLFEVDSYTFRFAVLEAVARLKDTCVAGRMPANLWELRDMDRYHFFVHSVNLINFPRLTLLYSWFRQPWLWDTLTEFEDFLVKTNDPRATAICRDWSIVRFFLWIFVPEIAVLRITSPIIDNHRWISVSLIIFVALSVVARVLRFVEFGKAYGPEATDESRKQWVNQFLGERFVIPFLSFIIQNWIIFPLFFPIMPWFIQNAMSTLGFLTLPIFAIASIRHSILKLQGTAAPTPAQPAEGDPSSAVTDSTNTNVTQANGEPRPHAE